MTRAEIEELVANGSFPVQSARRRLIETHISWVIVSGDFVYKIKKPIRYPFLDFSTLARRRHFCLRELKLNRRLAKKIYLGVVPVRRETASFAVYGGDGKIVDYAVQMKRIDGHKQMDVLLLKNKVSTGDIRRLASKISSFHGSADIVHRTNVLAIGDKFNDLKAESVFLHRHLGRWSREVINDAIIFSNGFLRDNRRLMEARLKKGFYRDCHGDLHSRNIFLLHSPVLFDCIEFNDDYRRIDMLNEVAFLCMDLDAFGKSELASRFMEYYNSLTRCMRTLDEVRLFVYYKLYRANVRLKVNSLRARSAASGKQRVKALAQARNYLRLMKRYIVQLA